MTVDVIKTIWVDGDIAEVVVGKATVTNRTNLKDLMTRLGHEHLGADINVRKDDPQLFMFIAVSRNGDTVHVR